MVGIQRVKERIALQYVLVECFSIINTVFCQFKDIFTDSTQYEESWENRWSQFLERKIEIHILARILQP